jgi:hypothetical protein
MDCKMVPNLEAGKIYRGKLFYNQIQEWRYYTYFVDRVITPPDGMWYVRIRVYTDGYYSLDGSRHYGPGFSQVAYFSSTSVAAFERVPLHEEVIFKIQFDTKYGNGGLV